MKKKKKTFDHPKKIRTTIEELEVMSRLKDTIEWAILKRWMQRYANNLMRVAFNLPYSYSGEEFKVAHRGLTAEIRAIKNLVTRVEKAPKKLSQMEEGQKSARY